MIPVALALGLATSTPAQVFTFVPEVLHAWDSAFYPTSIAVGDVDRDGHADLVVTGRNVDGLMSVFRGLGGGAFENPEPLLFGRQSNWSVLRDFDGNGTLDLAVSYRTRKGGIAILPGHGDGRFMMTEDYQVGREPALVESGDFDGDGWPDLAVASYQSDELTVLLNRGHAVFETQPSLRVSAALNVPGRPFSMTTGDFDSDGTPDVASINLTSGHVVVAPVDGDGQFEPFVRMPLGSPASVAASDVDNDGTLDLVMPEIASGGAVLHVLRNDGALGFVDEPISFPGGWVWYIAMADLDGDGSDDAIISDALESALHVLRGSGDGSFTDEAFLPTGGFPRMILPYDYDGDCDIDLLVVDIATHQLMIWRNETPQAGGCVAYDLDGDGTVGFGDLLVLLANWGSFTGVGDFDADGVVDFDDLLALLGAFVA